MAAMATHEVAVGQWTKPEPAVNPHNSAMSEGGQVSDISLWLAENRLGQYAEDLKVKSGLFSLRDVCMLSDEDVAEVLQEVPMQDLTLTLSITLGLSPSISLSLSISLYPMHALYPPS